MKKKDRKWVSWAAGTTAAAVIIAGVAYGATKMVQYNRAEKAVIEVNGVATKMTKSVGVAGLLDIPKTEYTVTINGEEHGLYTDGLRKEIEIGKEMTFIIRKKSGLVIGLTKSIG